MGIERCGRYDDIVAAFLRNVQTWCAYNSVSGGTMKESSSENDEDGGKK